MSQSIINGGAGQAPEPGYVVTTNNGIKTLTQATFRAIPGNAYGEIDPISRPDASASANFINLDGRWRLSPA